MSAIKNKANYTVYEFIYKTELFGDIVILAHVEKEFKQMGLQNTLKVWLKTADNMGFMHFVVGYGIKNDSELLIRKEIKELAECGYFDGVIDTAFDNENKLEFINSELWEV